MKLAETETQSYSSINRRPVAFDFIWMSHIPTIYPCAPGCLTNYMFVRAELHLPPCAKHQLLSTHCGLVMRQESLTLVQVKASAQPAINVDSMWNWPTEQTSVQFKVKYNNFNSRRYIWKCHPIKGKRWPFHFIRYQCVWPLLLKAMSVIIQWKQYLLECIKGIIIGINRGIHMQTTSMYNFQVYDITRFYI